MAALPQTPVVSARLVVVIRIVMSSPKPANMVAPTQTLAVSVPDVKVTLIVMLLPKLVIMAVLPQTLAVNVQLVSLVLTLVQPVPPHLLAQAVITLKPSVQHNVAIPATLVSKMQILAIIELMLLVPTDAKLIGAIVLPSARPVTLITAIIERLLVFRQMLVVLLTTLIVLQNVLLGLVIQAIFNLETVVLRNKILNRLLRLLLLSRAQVNLLHRLLHQKQHVKKCILILMNVDMDVVSVNIQEYKCLVNVATITTHTIFVVLGTNYGNRRRIIIRYCKEFAE